MSNDTEELVIKITGSMGNPKLQDLVAKLKNEGLSSRESTEAVCTLWKKAALDLLEPSPSSTLSRYALSLQSLWFWTITALVASMIPIASYLVAPPILYIRYVLGASFILFLPGSVLTQALYPKSRDLEGLERLALSIGLSLAVIPFIGLLLNYTPWGIRPAPISISIATFTEAMAITALVRKYRYYILTSSSDGGCRAGRCS